jgi:hypothetical protein
MFLGLYRIGSTSLLSVHWLTQILQPSAFGDQSRRLEPVRELRDGVQTVDRTSGKTRARERNHCGQKKVVDARGKSTLKAGRLRLPLPAPAEQT